MNEKDVIIQANRGFRRYLFWSNIILTPLGIMGGLAFGFFLNDKSADGGDVIGSGVVVICAIFMLGFGIYYRKKKVTIQNPLFENEIRAS